MQLSAGLISHNKMIIESFYAIANVKRDWRSVLKERLLSQENRDLKHSNTYQYAKELTEFLFIPEDVNQPDKPVELNFDLVTNVIPSFKVGGLTFYGPADLLSDLTFGEFLEALTNMDEYFQSKQEKHLDYFICALYRPQHLPGARMPLDDHYKDLGKHIYKLPAHKKYGILLWFTTCIKYIKEGPLIIDGKEINFSVLFPSGSSGGKGSSGLGWKSLLYGIAKEGLFGNIRKTTKAKLFEVLLFLYDNHYKQLHLNSKNKANG